MNYTNDKGEKAISVLFKIKDMDSFKDDVISTLYREDLPYSAVMVTEQDVSILEGDQPNRGNHAPQHAQGGARI